jgi:hypothetical protein
MARVDYERVALGAAEVNRSRQTRDTAADHDHFPRLRIIQIFVLDHHDNLRRSPPSQPQPSRAEFTQTRGKIERATVSR